MSEAKQDKAWWSAREFSVRYGMNYKVVLEMLDKGQIKGAFRPGARGRWRIDKAIFLKSLEDRDAA